MKLRYKILSGIIITLTVAITALSLVISKTDDCVPATAVSSDSELMKAIVYRCYGSADVLEYADVVKPIADDNDVLVKIKTSSVNPLEWHYMRGSPYLLRLMTGLGAPDDTRLGTDYSGVVEAVGKNVTKFKVGDEVFGYTNGAFAEYTVVREDRGIVLKPANVSFRQAGSIGITGATAIQALRDIGKIERGQKVLINGASGGVGTLAVQIAKSFGAEVTGVSSAKNHPMVKSIGADHMIDYKTENYTESGIKYDLIIDMIGNKSLLNNRDVMTEEGRLVMVGGAKGDWIAPLLGLINSMVISPFVDQKFEKIIAQLKTEDMQFLAEMMEKGTLIPILDDSFPLNKTADAIRYSESGRARGKIVIEVD
jgi:NADPH:quinone reductase-like Zn-dependent oxidoreductase